MYITVGIQSFDAELPRRLASEYARQLLSKMLMDAGISVPAPLPLRMDDNGRPYAEHPALKNCVDFNLSHAGRYAVCALAVSEKGDPAPRVGVDIEIPHRHMATDRIAKRFFSDAELAYLEKNAFAESVFLEIWTKKEAYLKFKGSGLSGGMRETDTQAPHRLDPPVRFALYPLENDPSAHLTLCIPEAAVPPRNVKYFGGI